MNRTALAALAAAILLPGLIVVLIMAPRAMQTRRSSTEFCTGMLGNAPMPNTTVAALSGLDAESLAAKPDSEGTAVLLSGEDAYRFVATLNTVTNWRSLPAQDVAAWISDPDRNPMPAGAELDDPWPPRRTGHQMPAGLEVSSLYEPACAAMLERVDDRASATTSPTAAAASSVASTSPAPPSPDRWHAPRARIVAAVLDLLGSPVSETDLWQAISPEPELDAKHMLFEELLYMRTVSLPQPGDVACYDFTVNGPTHCALVIVAAEQRVADTTGASTTTTEPAAAGLPADTFLTAPLIAVRGVDGTLVAQPMPLNSTVITPSPEGRA